MPFPLSVRFTNEPNGAILRPRRAAVRRVLRGCGCRLTCRPGHGRGAECRDDERARAADREGELGTAAVAHPADDERAERRERAPPGVIAAEHPAAAVVRACHLARGG